MSKRQPTVICTKCGAKVVVTKRYLENRGPLIKRDYTCPECRSKGKGASE